MHRTTILLPEELKAQAEKSQHLWLTTKDYRDFLLHLSHLFLGVVSLKADRVRDHLEAFEPGAAIGPTDQLDAIRSALKPGDQIFRLVTAVYDYFTRSMSAEQKMRIAYYHLSDDHLEPIHCWDGLSSKCIATPRTEHRDRFRIDGGNNECLAVWVAQTGKIRVVSNAAEGDQDSEVPFRFFDDNQRSKIKSIVAFPLRRGDEGLPCEHVITIDTDKEGFFQSGEGAITQFKKIAENLAHRLLLEADVQKLLEDR